MQREDRRGFLKKGVGALPAVWVAARSKSTDAAATAPQEKLPQIQLGRHSISRLICGSNCFNGGSHLSTFVNQEMRSYYTPQQILKTLRRCVEVGINCWQMSYTTGLDLYRQLVDEGTGLHIISLSREPAELPALAQAGCLGVAHHGEVTDQLFKKGKLRRGAGFPQASSRLRDAGGCLDAHARCGGRD